MGQTLNNGSLLQGGRYKILSVLGQGGFGITYLAMQSGLRRKVAVKEFFMKEMCSRDESTSHVTLGTEGARETVERFREKFLKEARNIARFNHPNIVRIIDVFEENGTAYYVMEYAECGSLSDKVKREGPMPEPAATRYIKQVASALDYIHRQHINHLDVKPGNVMLNERDESILIDIGLSKQYDVESGNQTSTTPVGISEGYAPMEQYKQGGVGTFSPETDVYALGATFFYLLTGQRPASASDVNEDGVPIGQLVARGVSQQAIAAITQAMESRKRDRLKSATAFIAALSSDATVSPVSDDTLVEATLVEEPVTAPVVEQRIPSPSASVKSKGKKWLWWTIGAAALAIVAVIIVVSGKRTGNTSEKIDSSDVAVENTPQEVSSKTFTANGVSFDMIYVKGSTFNMGATPEQEEPFLDEKSVHQVTLNDYYLGKTEVTQALWQAVMGSNPSYNKGDDLPVENVSWDNCQEFVKKLNALTGQHFRLPTEAEWEFAARGGCNSRGYQYSGSNNIYDVAWYGDNSGTQTHSVATKAPNELGIHDMSGNVWEWCQDWYGSYSSSAHTNPTGPSSGVFRLYRGGGWRYDAKYCRSAARNYDTPVNHFNVLGLRLGLSL